MLIDSGRALVDEPPALERLRRHPGRRDGDAGPGEADLSWLIDDPCLALPRSTWRESRPSPAQADVPDVFAQHVLSQLHARLETERITAGLPPSREVWARRAEPEVFEGESSRFELRAGAPDERGAWQSPDVRLVLAEDLPSPASGRELDNWAWQTFGTNWDATGPATDVLRTRFEDRRIPQPGRAPRFVRHLDHQPFAQVFRIESRAAAPRLVTFRVFLALADRTEDPALWLQLDTFQRELEPGPNVVLRPDHGSSVLRVGARGPGKKAPRRPAPEDRPGWPYQLLLPRGSEAGTRFRMLVLVTEDGASPAPTPRGPWDSCGGGPRDGRPPAFPFCHPFPSGIEAGLLALDQAALRDVTIQHDPSGRWRGGERQAS
jgi:hypothetical protein